MFGDPRQVHLLPLTSFQRAIRYTSDKPIHDSNARAIVIGKDVYYSPNSSRKPPLPVDNPQYVRDPLKDCVEEFHNPQWWNTEMGYLPFLPTSPHFGSPPFHQLYNKFLETGPRQKRRVRMDSSDIINWSRLEATLTQIFHSFQSTYCIPDMFRVIETSVACQDPFEYPSQFLSVEKKCRNWFAIYMAMVSLGIAVAQVYDGDTETTLVPKWYTTFVQHTDEALLAGVRQQLGQFHPSFPRAGVFLNLCSSQEQPTVDFFVRLNIPVWYPWGSAEESYARQNPSYWAKYMPPADMLQRAHSFLTGVPGLAPPATQGSEEDNRPWALFFSNRARHATGPITARRPPMKVFHWEKDDSGKWQRIAVLKQLRSETLDEYGKNQKVFDERSNEWDCCTEMGDLDAEERQALADEDFESIVDTGPSASELSDAPVSSSDAQVSSSDAQVSSSNDQISSSDGQISSSNAQVSSSALPPVSRSNQLPSALNDSADLSQLSTSHEVSAGTSSESGRNPASYLPEQHSPSDLLHLFYGFVVPPPSVRLHIAQPSEQQIKDLALGVGCSKPDLIHSYVQTPLGRYAPHFFWAMSQSPWVSPSNILFDLARGNPKNIQYRRRIKYLHQLPGDTYLFDFEKEATVEWRICVTDVSLALLILRLDDELCDQDIARKLLEQGSHFWTVFDSAPFDVVPPHPGISRLRLSSYQFSAEDYRTYCHDRDEILCSPRVARQCLMRGGILWRLAMEHASFQDVLAGPTPTATIRHQCRSFSAGPDRFYIDDVLTAHEEEVICGVYYVYTGKVSKEMYICQQTDLSSGQGTQMAKKSWWPLPELWEVLARQPFWQERSEQWYNKRLQELESGSGVPLTTTQWRSRSKMNSVVRRAILNNAEVSKAFLKDLRLRH